MSQLSDFAEKVMRRFSKRKTDEIFLMIQTDKKLMYEYLKLVEKNGPDDSKSTHWKKS